MWICTVSLATLYCSQGRRKMKHRVVKCDTAKASGLQDSGCVARPIRPKGELVDKSGTCGVAPNG